MKTRTLLILVAAALGVMASTAKSQQLVAKGDFEIFSSTPSDVPGVVFEYSITQADALVNEYVVRISNLSVPGTGWVEEDRPTARLILFDAAAGSSSSFDAGSLTYSNAGIKYNVNSGANLPAGNDLMPPFTTDFGLQAAPPPTFNGIEPGEFVEIAFTSSFNPWQLADSFVDGDFRIGLHVIQFGEDGEDSVSLINRPPTETIPEPSGVALIALTALAATLRRRR